MGKPLRVLIVDDAEPDALRMVALLRSGGYEPVFARVETAPGLLAALPREEWDVVVTDHALPHFGALEVLEILRAQDRDLPVIVVAGSVSEEELVAVMRAGAHDCLVKGNLGRLCVAVDRSLRDAEERRARRESDLRRSEAEERYRALVE
ncbi:MAG TPA: response regulator, partial [Vicinamibacteria bacterium]|nr:response regulator [Vicinamibacteria bacterium]